MAEYSCVAPSVLVFGKSGQLAVALSSQQGRSIRALGRADVDVTAVDSVRAAIRQSRPDLVINASAYTAVDAAESERDAALALNAEAPGVLAACAAEAGVAFVHVSTDYVFDGSSGTPNSEDDPLSPVNFYGETKRLGERAVLERGGRSAIVRTSWVFSGGGNNFVRTMIRLAKDRDEIGVVADQHGRPTGADDLAAASLAIGDRIVAGQESAVSIFHFANTGDTTWAQFAEAVMEEAGNVGLKTARIRPITTAEYPTRAKRPRDGRLNTSRVEAFLGVRPRSWREPLREAVRAFAATEASG